MSTSYYDLLERFFQKKPICISSYADSLFFYEFLVLTAYFICVRDKRLSIPFISAQVRGVFLQSFCDFGESFEVYDTDGLEPISCILSNITQV